MAKTFEEEIQPQTRIQIFLNRDIADKLEKIADESMISISDLIVHEFYKTEFYAKVYADIQLKNQNQSSN